ncbi:MAG TPA: LLM class F420-dependent oxidoreductase [Acidimicrobiales bacterium]|nr:LLM class F420-dependent oxidoreductase [Acidimicrobiales bacterium]
MHIGLTIPFPGVSLTELPGLVRRAEAAGYESLWSEESVTFDGLTPLVVAAQHSERIRLVSGVVNAYTRGPALLAQSAAALAELSGGRFVLGLGASSDVIVERWNGYRYERPLSKVRDLVGYLRPVLAGERAAGGFKLARPPAQPVPIVVAALRAQMLRLAGEIADGAFTNFLPLGAARRVVETFGAPGKELACRFFAIPGPEPEALARARRFFASYATVPVYSDFFRWLGFGDSIDPLVAAWNAGDRAAALELVPEELVREIFLVGPPGQQRERLAAFAEAGISTAVLALLVPEGELAAALDAYAPR